MPGLSVRSFRPLLISHTPACGAAVASQRLSALNYAPNTVAS